MASTAVEKTIKPGDHIYVCKELKDIKMVMLKIIQVEKKRKDSVINNSDPMRDIKGDLFPACLYFTGEKVKIEKKDAFEFAKRFRPAPQDVAQWPSGLQCVKCFRCEEKPTHGYFAVEKLIRYVTLGKEKTRTLTCRMMPHIVCEKCYAFFGTQPSVKLPSLSSSSSPLPSLLSRWTDSVLVVKRLSDSFLTEFSEGRKTTDIESNSFHQHYLTFTDTGSIPAQSSSSSSASSSSSSSNQTSSNPSSSTSPSSSSSSSSSSTDAKKKKKKKKKNSKHPSVTPAPPLTSSAPSSGSASSSLSSTASSGLSSNNSKISSSVPVKT
eukprot:TRINITY_DN76_c1_g1_i5.p1 TRINITY_DN76_c1_g1~~TRINITY_DN76_c1_g1_i5.p1  ORF type:complete len:323 (+),score=113.39 TRINITY_DN76_c1_g1_i5:40-1008(+)